MTLPEALDETRQAVDAHLQLCELALLLSSVTTFDADRDDRVALLIDRPDAGPVPS